VLTATMPCELLQLAERLEKLIDYGRHAPPNTAGRRTEGVYHVPAPGTRGPAQPAPGRPARELSSAEGPSSSVYHRGSESRRRAPSCRRLTVAVETAPASGSRSDLTTLESAPEGAERSAAVATVPLPCRAVKVGQRRLEVRLGGNLAHPPERLADRLFSWTRTGAPAQLELSRVGPPVGLCDSRA
jgi:hypothetical protein